MCRARTRAPLGPVVPASPGAPCTEQVHKHMRIALSRLHTAVPSVRDFRAARHRPCRPAAIRPSGPWRPRRPARRAPP